MRFWRRLMTTQEGTCCLYLAVCLGLSAWLLLDGPAQGCAMFLLALVTMGLCIAAFCLVMTWLDALPGALDRRRAERRREEQRRYAASPEGIAAAQERARLRAEQGRAHQEREERRKQRAEAERAAQARAADLHAAAERAAAERARAEQETRDKQRELAEIKERIRRNLDIVQGGRT